VICDFAAERQVTSALPSDSGQKIKVCFGRLWIATDYGKLCAGKRADVSWQVVARIPYFA